jgi:hypothetical protein
VRGQTQVKPREVCVRGYKGGGPRMSDINEGYRSKPQQNQSNYLDATSAEQKGCIEAHRSDSFTESVHLEAGKT